MVVRNWMWSRAFNWLGRQPKSGRDRSFGWPPSGYHRFRMDGLLLGSRVNAEYRHLCKG